MTITPFLLSTADEETRLSLLLEKAIRKSEAVDRESLCIVAGEKVRHSLKITVFLLSLTMVGRVAPLTGSQP